MPANYERPAFDPEMAKRLQKPQHRVLAKCVMRYQEHVEYLTVYTAAMEREFIRSQQRQPEPLLVPRLSAPGRPRADAVELRESVLAVLANGGWWTNSNAARAAGQDRQKVNYVLKNLVAAGWVEAEQKDLSPGRSSVPQRYRLRGGRV